ncbi:polyol transporter 5-like [Miscanthus floridulus]|uniref:polyol transporter 5-like n=1 Tax=Miscanthus floridulus TaxID=154761 RepID=UPI0034591DEF
MAHDGIIADDGAATPLLASSANSGKPRWNMYAFACATLASMTTILMGYNLALMSGTQLFIREDLGLSDGQIEVLAGSINVFMLMSILAAGWAADSLGRRGTLVLANVFLMAGVPAMSLGSSYSALMAARCITSIGSGFSVVVTSVYNAEISPASMRCFLSSFLDMFISLGLLLSYLSNYAFAGLPVHLGWRIMYGVGVLPPVLLAVGVLAMPESPRWLAMRGRHADARAVLVRTSDTPVEADLRLEEIKQAVREPQVSDSDGGSNVWKELIIRPSASVRQILVCVVGVNFFQQASGIDAHVLYSPLVFRKDDGMSSNKAVLGATVAAGVVKMCFVLVATLFSDRLGRRPLLLASTAGVAASMASLGVTTLCVGGAGSMAASVLSVLAFMAAFSIGFGPLAGTYSAEIMPLQLRALGASLGTAVNRLTSALVSMTFISLADAMTMPGCFFLYAGVGASACAFVYARMPETKGRSLEDMEVLFAK